MTPKRILLYLHEEQISWLIMDETGQLQQPVLKGNIADLTPLAKDHDVYVIVPGQSVLLTSASLPKLNSQRLKQALPFALEEQLIDDVNNLHFAVGDYQPDNSFPVAVVAKEQMDKWLSILQQADIIPTMMIPTILALPFTPQNGSICINNEIAIVRTDQYEGFACDRENLLSLLELHLTDKSEKISSMHIYNFSSTAISLQAEAIAFNEINLNENQFLEHLMKWTATYPFINLLQGPYQTKTKTTVTKKIWITASCLALVWIGLALMNNIVSLLFLHHASAAPEQLIEKIYKRNFPQASSVVAPKLRMEEKLKKLSASANKNNFLTLLGITGNILSKTTDIKLLGLEYRSNQLTLNVTAPTFEKLDAFMQAFTHEHLTVKQQNAGIAGAAVKANLLITQGAL